MKLNVVFSSCIGFYAVCVLGNQYFHPLTFHRFLPCRAVVTLQLKLPPFPEPTSSLQTALGICFDLGTCDPVFLPSVMETCLLNGLLDLFVCNSAFNQASRESNGVMAEGRSGIH